ncbi:hypothetical protein JCM8097_000681 [Rhodosporidiobolus ruineniae]
MSRAHHPFFPAYAAGPVRFDVRLVFPRCGRELWTSEAILSQSPYFRLLFSSGFLEATGDEVQSAAADGKPTFEDSDDEIDPSLPKPSSSSSTSPSTASSTVLPPHQTINITEAAYSTYSAVVCWLLSGQISFGRLTSSHASDGWGGMTPTGKISVTFPQVPSNSPNLSPFPPPVSPKSVYRLAHLLELDKLAAVALSEYRHQLTASNAVQELLTETSHCYESFGDTVIGFVVDHRRAVLDSKGMKELKARAEADELEYWEGKMWMKLALALMEKDEGSGRGIGRGWGKW